MSKRLTLDRLHAEVNGLTLHFGLRLEHIVIEAQAATVDIKTGALELGAEGRLTAEILPEGVTSLLEARSKGMLRDVVVRMPDGEIEIEATAKVVFEVRATLTCRLRVVEGRQVFVDLVDLSVPVARGLVEGQLEQLNPVFDVADLPLALELTRVAVEGGRIAIEGRVPVTP